MESEHPHVIRELQRDNSKVNVWFGIMCNRIIGPFFYHEATTNADVYLYLLTDAPINSRLNVVVRSPTPFGLGRNGCCPSRGSKVLRALPFIFLLCCPMNDHRRAAHSFFISGFLFSLSLLSCPSLARLHLLILLLLLMSGNAHPNPGRISHCSVCAGNVIWWVGQCNAAHAPNGSI